LGSRRFGNQRHYLGGDEVVKAVVLVTGVSSSVIEDTASAAGSYGLVTRSTTPMVETSILVVCLKNFT